MPDIDLAQITPVTDSTVARLPSSAAYDELASHIMAASVPAGPATDPAQAPSRDPAQAPSRGRGRRVSRWLAPVAAMVAVVAVAGVTVAGRQVGRGPASAGQSAAGRPDIYVTVTARYMQPLQASPGGGLAPATSSPVTVGTATIRDASTGAALTSLQLWPRQPEHPRGPAVRGGLPEVAVKAAADDRTFAISDQGVTEQGGLYLLHVAASGRAAQLVRLNVTIPGDAVPDFDLSPDATKLVAAVFVCPHNGACVYPVDGIAIITLATGIARTWLDSSPTEQAMSPSWTDNGKAVMFEWSSAHGAVWGQRILSDAAPQGNLTAESEPLRYPLAAQPAAQYPTGPVGTPAVLTPDGRSVLVVTERIAPASRSITFRITDVAPGTGRLLRVLRVFQTHYQGNPYLSGAACNILSLAPAGVHALVECPQFGRLDGSTFTPLPSGPPGLPNAPTIDAAW
jgi:hypothetical protein